MKKRTDATIVATAGVAADPAYRSVAPPLWASDTFQWPNATDKPSYDYSRTVNPNRDLLSSALAELEGAAGGVITSSGEAASLLILLMAPADALIVAPHDCYGGTYRQIKALGDQGKMRVLFVDQTDPSALDAALAQKPAQVWIETPSNPLLRVVDIAEIARKSKAAGALVVVDNTLPTPVRQRPLELGCDISYHSTTKAINGHSDLFGGAVLAKDPALAEQVVWWCNAMGLASSAHDAWQVLRGLRTLPLRVDRSEETARQLAAWLEAHPKVHQVFYPGLASHPDHALSARQTSGPGFMVAFRVKGGDDATAAFLSKLEVITLASSLGGFSSLVCAPSSMTHRGMPPEAQALAGITPDLLRLSVGLEDPADLIADFEGAFAAI